MNKDFDLREVMRRWVTGVAIVTSGDGESRHGMTVNSFISHSINPPIISVTLANDTRTKRLVERTRLFAVTLLFAGQEEISDRFAGRTGEQIDRFAGLEVKVSDNGIPVLKNGAAGVECKVIHEYAMELSTLFVAEVIGGWKNEDKPPLVYFNREYHGVSK